ncbi:MAG: zf-HC2 domain-containing protein [Phycisphaerales bacterium]|nr:zf-HC2 domain-containing protein [Phycisphaerales bacterium]
MTCRELTDFMMAYLDGELPDGERLAFERHLAVCPSCVEYLKSYSRTVGLTRSLAERPDDPVPAEVPAGLVNAILAARKRSAS